MRGRAITGSARDVGNAPEVQSTAEVLVLVVVVRVTGRELAC